MPVAMSASPNDKESPTPSRASLAPPPPPPPPPKVAAPATETASVHGGWRARLILLAAVALVFSLDDWALLGGGDPSGLHHRGVAVHGGGGGGEASGGTSEVPGPVILDEDVFERPPFAPLPGCPNFLVVSSTFAGMGHRLMAVAVALKLSRDTSAALVMDANLWAGGSPEHGEGYGFLQSLLSPPFLSTTDFGLSIDKEGMFTNQRQFESRWGVLLPSITESVDHAAMVAPDGCRNIIMFQTGHPRCTDPATGIRVFCAYVQPYYYAAAKPYMRRVYEKSPLFGKPLTEFQLPRDALVVLWHIRNDDIKLHAREVDFFRVLREGVLAGLGGLSARHYVLSQYPIGEGDPNFGFLHTLGSGSNGTPQFTFLAGVGVEASLLHMVAVDVLVHTGSSFSLSAALISHPTQVHVYCAPKESKEMGDAAYLGYLMDDMVPVQLGGDVLEADQQRMVALTARRLKHRQAGGD
jgi:hypothetical protein